MYYEGYQTDKDDDDRTPLMLWIFCRRYEAIPEELYYPNYQTDKDEYGQTPLMLWIKYRRCENIP